MDSRCISKVELTAFEVGFERQRGVKDNSRDSGLGNYSSGAASREEGGRYRRSGVGKMPLIFKRIKFDMPNTYASGAVTRQLDT